MIEWATNQWRSIWHVGLPRRSAAALLFAFACVAVATGVRMGLALVSPEGAVSGPYFAATLVSALVGGPEVGAVAAVLGRVTAYWFFEPPAWDLASFRIEPLINLLLYGASSAIIIWAAVSYRGLLHRLRREEEVRQLLNREMAHRIGNVLAGVQAIVGHSLRDQPQLLATVYARLAALGATNDLLLKSEWRNVPLREILVRELTPYGLSRCGLRGDEVDCPHSVAVLLALIFHELATNAVKYGALSSPDGRIDVSWTAAGRRLALEWVESGGPAPKPPMREGFGTKLLRSGVKQYCGDLDCRLEPSGLRCNFSLTLPSQAEEAGGEERREFFRGVLAAGETISPAKTKLP